MNKNIYIASLQDEYPSAVEAFSGVDRQLRGGVGQAPISSDDGAVVWSWIHPRPPLSPPGARWFVAWGLLRPALSTWWRDMAPPLRADDHAFVCVASDNAPLPLDRVQLPTGWSQTADEAAVSASLASFAPSGSASAAGLAGWMVKRAQEGITLLREAALLAH